MHRGRLTLAALAFCGAAFAGPVEEGVAQRVEALRAIHPGQPEDVTRGYNARMDEAWRYFAEHRAVAVPELRRRLGAEMASKSPNGLVLLDLAAWLQREGEAADRKLAAEALFRLDPGDAVVRENVSTLFHLAHAVALTGDARIPGFAQRAFLERPTAIFLPSHALTLDGTLASVFLYGLQPGDAGEAALRRALAEPRARDRAIETLIWVGGPASVAAVVKAMEANPRHDTFARGLAFLMTVGGPEGRRRLLAFDASRLDERARGYFRDVLPDVKAVDAASLRAPFAGVEGDGKLSPEAARARLEAMAREGAHDERTAPLALLDSGLASAELVRLLREVRRAALRRVSDEALLEVKLANAMMNAVFHKENNE